MAVFGSEDEKNGKSRKAGSRLRRKPGVVDAVADEMAGGSDLLSEHPVSATLNALSRVCSERQEEKEAAKIGSPHLEEPVHIREAVKYFRELAKNVKASAGSGHQTISGPDADHASAGAKRALGPQSPPPDESSAADSRHEAGQASAGRDSGRHDEKSAEEAETAQGRFSRFIRNEKWVGKKGLVFVGTAVVLGTAMISINRLLARRDEREIEVVR